MEVALKDSLSLQNENKIVKFSGSLWLGDAILYWQNVTWHLLSESEIGFFSPLSDKKHLHVWKGAQGFRILASCECIYLTIWC